MSVWRLGVVMATVMLVSSAVAQHAPVVETASGKLRGVMDDEVVSFKGIPFAAPPVGELRWRAPQPTASWEGVRDATEFGRECPQAPFMPADTPGPTTDEDCLYLNVWTPAHRDDASLPVMVWIHGGGFVNGGTADPVMDGANMVRRGVVLVSANYRLGRFGFFAHPALTAAQADNGRLGNYGLMDQIAALHWVRENIASFGGDPANVTIFGESAGGMSVNHLMAAPTARGLFARAIAQSGMGREYNDLDFPFLPLTAPEGELSAEAVGVLFATEHGVEGTDAQALAALRALPASAIVNGLNLATMFTQHFTGPIGETTDAPVHFEEIYRAGKAAPVPLIIGATDADGFFGFYQQGDREQIFAKFGALRAEAERLYDPAGDRGDHHIGTLVSADSLFIEPARCVARLHSARGHPTYAYRFSYLPDHQRAQMLGAAHASDIAFTFGSMATWFGVPPTDNDRRVSEEVQSYWVEFARTGEPSPPGLPAWPRYDAEGDIILDFRLEGPTIGPDPARTRLDFAARIAEAGRGD